MHMLDENVQFEKSREIIPPTTFNHFINLAELDLSWNQIVYLEEGTFEVLKMTNSFRDVYNFMPQYFSLLLSTTQIEEIYADNNNFVEAFGNEEFFMLPSTLKVCDFANNRLLKFHFGMPYLLTLNLRYNSLV
ncbi:uncharacterized protein LOC127718680 [Mytilus californianus]|uniref:uncharacterized protein LOC127718680 n=1 Tax=Mytilus californianus TaxID=6549 RepID=UPI002245BB53|nr:uncharacterized protein LOC127718680 [Mytilus californianus]